MMRLKVVSESALRGTGVVYSSRLSNGDERSNRNEQKSEQKTLASLKRDALVIDFIEVYSCRLSPYFL